MAIRTSSSASSRNRKKRISRSSRSPESMSPRWSRDSSQGPETVPPADGEMAPAAWAAALPGPVTSCRPAAVAGAPTAGEGAVARKRARPVPVAGCGCMPPARCGCPGYTRYPSHSDRNFFPRWMSLARCAARSTLPCFSGFKNGRRAFSSCMEALLLRPYSCASGRSFPSSAGSSPPNPPKPAVPSARLIRRHRRAEEVAAPVRSSPHHPEFRKAAGPAA